MRIEFKQLLLNKMHTNSAIIVLTADLGYKMFDDIRSTFPDRFFNVGASEQLLLGASVGLSYEGYIPVAYSITPFLLYRPFEIIRNYLHHEGCNVKLVGSGQGTDYAHDGFSHHDFTGKDLLDVLKLKTYYPSSKEELASSFDTWISESCPSFLGLRR